MAGVLMAQVGTVRGIVIEDASGLELIGATVLLEDTGTGTVTDLDGSFSLELPVGTHNLQFSYVSFATKTITDVEVKAGEVTLLGEVRLSEELVEIATVVVTARATQNTETAIQTLQRKGINTIDGISSQAFTMRGDGTAAAALRRVTGLSVEGGKYVYVRGLGDRYSKTTLNGSNIPGLDPDKNTVQMDLFPSNLIDNIIVYKNFTPNLPGDFSGGLIDISTKDFPETFTLQARVGAGYNPNSNFNNNFLTYQGSPTDWLGYDNGFRNFPQQAQGLPSPTEVIIASNQGNYEPARQVTEATLGMNNVLNPAVQAPLADHNFSISLGNQTKLGSIPFGFIASVTYDRSYSGYANGTTGRYKNISPSGAPESLNTERLLSDNRYSTSTLLGGMLSGALKLNNSNKITLNLLRNQSGQSDARFQEGRVFGSSVNGTYQERTLAYEQRALSSAQILGSHATADGRFKVKWASSYTLSQMLQPDLRFVNNFVDTIAGVPAPLIDPAEDIPPTRFRRSMNESNWDNNLDLVYGFRQWTGENATIKLGGSFLTKERSFRDTLYRYMNPNSGNVGDFNNYVTNDNVWIWNGEQENTQGVFLQDFSEARNQYDSRMNIYGAYAMTELPLTQRLKSIFGVRMEKTDLFFTSFDPSKKLDDTKVIDAIDPLPSAALIYAVMKEKMNLRASYSRTIARPTFREVAPIALFDVVNNAVIIGNPDLQRTLIDNIDFRWEYFFKPGEVVSLSLFYKAFQNPIELVFSPIAPNKEWQYQNVAKGAAYGLEFEFQKSLSFVSFLRDFSVGTNLTLVYSEVDIPANELAARQKLDPNAAAIRPLFNQSPYIVNGFLSYHNRESGTRANLSYNVQGPRLKVVSLIGTPDVFEKPFHALDFKITQNIAKGFSASFTANNILNSQFRETQTYRDVDYIFQGRFPGRSFSLGLSYTIGKE